MRERSINWSSFKSLFTSRSAMSKGAREFDDLRLGSIELFCLTAQHRGFTAAAKAAGLTAAAVSRSVARLESRLGVRLLMRTTRQVRLTDAGERYYLQCRQALGQLI